VNRRNLIIVSVCLAGFAAVESGAAADADTELGLTLERRGTAQVYFAYHGRPLLSFGGISDFIFYAADDAYDYRLWADWAAEHGMSHVRAYPPLSWKHQVAFAKTNGGDPNNVVFPYLETEPGSRQFDLTRFNPAYWERFREQLAYLEKKGIIVHLLMWNGWQLRAADSHSSPTAPHDWEGHFFNPANNVNAFTNVLGQDADRRFAIYHSVADGNVDLTAAQQAWFEKQAEIAGEFDNVYFDLVHELAEHQGEWTKTRQWIQHMALAVRKRFEKQATRPCILGMDTGGLKEEQRDWIFNRPFFDVLVYGKKHTVENALRWRRQYKKPYIPQESWDDDGTKYRLIYPQDRTHIRKYMWKLMMAKCQQMDLYMKPLHGRGDEVLTKYPHNYDPRGHNAFERDALVLRSFWNGLVDYPNLVPWGTMAGVPGSHKYVLASAREAVLCISSATGRAGVTFNPTQIKLNGLPLKPGKYALSIWDPKAVDARTASNPKPIATRNITVQEGGEIGFNLPEFTDDLIVHIADP